MTPKKSIIIHTCLPSRTYVQFNVKIIKKQLKQISHPIYHGKFSAVRSYFNIGFSFVKGELVQFQ